MDKLIADGGPAFPSERQMLRGNPAMSVTVSVQGMSLRDWFAGMALIGLAPIQNDEPEDRAGNAYALADAMIAERAKSTEVKA